MGEGASPQEFFHNAHNFTMNNSTIIGVYQANEAPLMKILAEETLQGAEFHSSERYPPPSCHPGTRQSICDNVRAWARNSSRKERLLWLHGLAGVGKSAIAQTIAETEPQSSTIFFSRPNKRNDPQRVFVTIAYQLVVKYPVYRQYVLGLLASDPKVVKKAMAQQFEMFIVKPFAENRLLDGQEGTALIILDGLDECSGERARRELILLIGKFAHKYPTAPLIWIITSRPEPHIKTAFSAEGVKASCLEMEVPFDTDEACRDVELYLREKFDEIRENYPESFPSTAQQWPLESHFLKVASRARGLFVFATTVVLFVDDENCGNPVSQLHRVLSVIDNTSSSASQNNPFATLDALYTEILSETPQETYIMTKNVLITHIYWLVPPHPCYICNWLGLTQADVYGALRKLYSVLRIPPPERPHDDIQVFHSSFSEYLLSPSRSGRFALTSSDMKELVLAISLRILSESHNKDLSIIQIPRICLSWASVPDEVVARGPFSALNINQTLFATCLRLLASFSIDAVDDCVWDALDHLRPFFEDLDFAMLAHATNNQLAWVLTGITRSHLFRRFEKWNVAQVIPIRSLDLSRIRLDVVARLHYFSGLSHIRPDPPRLAVDTLVGLHLHARHPQTESKFVHLGACIPHAWRKRFEEDAARRAHVCQHLTTVMNVMPLHPVTLFYKGPGSCALVVLEMDEQIWVYALPYDLS